MQQKTFPFELTESKGLDDQGVFEGYASVFGNVDAGGDVVMLGAFRKTLQEQAGRVRICWQHNWREPIGKPLEMREDSRGLYVKAHISDTSLGRDVRTLLRDGVVNELSIGYDVIRQGWADVEGRKVRQLQELRLYEISPVTVAMNEQARITAVKADTDLTVEMLAGYEPLRRIEIALARWEQAQEREWLEAAQKTLADLLAAAEPPVEALTAQDIERQRLALRMKLWEVQHGRQVQAAPMVA